MNVIITLEEGHQKQISNIAKSLRDVGVKVDQILQIAGVITGSVNAKSDVSKLKIKGVKSIEISKKVRAI